ncbi:MAG: hypothetical protein D6730_03445 [Bacteroidetes bacterium]|nr:MAG: hypothetical protein D6730_03445 [Bacteroidota bacterium]
MLVTCLIACLGLNAPLLGQQNEKEPTRKERVKKKKKEKKPKKSNKQTAPSQAESGNKSVLTQKEEAAFWKQKAARYVKDPLNLKREIEILQEEVLTLKQANESMESQSDDQRMMEYDSLLSALEMQEKQLKLWRQKNAELARATEAKSKAAESGLKQGLIFRLKMESDAGPRAFLFGEFRTEEGAEQFRKQMLRIGLRGQMQIVPFMDGREMSPQELKGYLSSNP